MTKEKKKEKKRGGVVMEEIDLYVKKRSTFVVDKLRSFFLHG